MSIEQAERGVVDARRQEYRVKCDVAKAFSDWGAAFRADRQRRSLSVHDVAKRAGVSFSYVAYVERGKRFPDERMRRQLREAIR